VSGNKMPVNAFGSNWLGPQKFSHVCTTSLPCLNYRCIPLQPPWFHYSSWCVRISSQIYIYVYWLFVLSSQTFIHSVLGPVYSVFSLFFPLYIVCTFFFSERFVQSVLHNCLYHLRTLNKSVICSSYWLTEACFLCMLICVP
jgi:hypothetical protein